MEKGSYKYRLRTAEFICTAICRAVQGPAPIQTSFHVLLVARGNRLRLVLTMGTRSSALRTKPEKSDWRHELTLPGWETKTQIRALLQNSGSVPGMHLAWQRALSASVSQTIPSRSFPWP